MSVLTSLVKFCEHAGIDTDAVDLYAEHDEIFIHFEHDIRTFYNEDTDTITEKGAYLEELGFIYSYSDKSWSIYT